MIPIKKEYLAGGLLLAAAGVWIPQFLGTPGEERPEDFTGPKPNEEIYTNPEFADQVDSTEPGSATLPPPTVLGGAAFETTPGDAVAQQDSETRDLAAILQALAEPELAGEVDQEPVEAEIYDDLERLRAFAAEMPLQGLIRGHGDSLALLGHRPARVGDTFQNGSIELVQIEQDHILLASGEATLDVTLPAFRARTAAAGEGEEGVAAEESDTEGGEALDDASDAQEEDQ